MEINGRRGAARLPSSSEAEMERTEWREFKAAAADPSHVRRAKVSFICSPQRQEGPSCDESGKKGGLRERDER